ncbi:sensor histidine kinase [Dyadobacter alkalitolerans]|uniref:sensor histidine kinase n=1 Tax=Dyadobacter alkalitolerans TaxID=492736 RepID=UPI0003FD1B21|nr:HAMP domain-containing sensor histidine kinase [Dyadobacter alkalitolerans]
MHKNLHKAGIIVAASIPVFILPARLSEGQWNDPVNLIGSEIVIFFMSLACWYCINYIQQKQGRWAGLALSLLCCCVLSNVFYFTFNPIFKDFPFRTAPNPIGVKILMLSSRGILMSVILIPAAYFLKRDAETRFQRKEIERLAIEKVKIENRLLEQAVMERTQALQQALISLEKSQEDLEHQLYIQSRLVASITHDIRGPFSFLIVVSREISRLADAKDYEPIHEYSTELHKSLETMMGFVENLLDFTKLPVHQKLAITEQVNLAQLVKDKADLFEGIIRTYGNGLDVNIDPSIHVSSNPNLLGIVLHNLIDNANKHTLNGIITITASVNGTEALVMLENTGNTVPDNIMQWLNSNAGSDGAYPPLGMAERLGIGLILVKEITSLLKIKLLMESVEQVTTVTLTFSQDHE